MRLNKCFVLFAITIAACSRQQPPPLQTPVAAQTCQYENRTYAAGQQASNLISIICGFDPRYSTLYPRWMPVDYLYPTQLPVTSGPG